MTRQTNTLPNTIRELTSDELDMVGGGTSDPGGGPLNGALGPKVDGVINAAGAAAVGISHATAVGVDGVLAAVGKF